MKFTGEIIGEEESADRDIETAIRRVDLLPQAMDSGAQKIVNRAKQIASSKGLNKTGAGISGIVYETENDDRLIGWRTRPNFHLYFHEIGTYKDYPRPHLRPAADMEENSIIENIRNTVVGD